MLLPDTSEQQLKQRTPGHRVLALDALRGLAACVVVLHHFREAFNMSEPVWYLRPLFAGHAAVILFFVLSGYVLSLPYWTGKQLPYKPYLIRRFFRIYVPYASATIVALIGAKFLLYSHLPLTEWFQRTWQTPLTLKLIAAQFFTMSVSPAINTAFWSLRYEMEMSIVFPVICWILLRINPWLALILTIAMEKLGFMLLLHSRVGLWQSASDTLIFASCFIYGALLARERVPIGRIYSRLPLWTKLIVAVLAILAYYGPRESVIPFAACAAIIFARYSRISRLLDTPVPEYLGRISYSVYLLHATVLWTTLILLYQKLPLICVGLIYLLVTAATSHLFCVWVEEPSMRLGKRLSASPPRALRPYHSSLAR